MTEGVDSLFSLPTQVYEPASKILEQVLTHNPIPDLDLKCDVTWVGGFEGDGRACGKPMLSFTVTSVMLVEGVFHSLSAEVDILRGQTRTAYACTPFQ